TGTMAVCFSPFLSFEGLRQVFIRLFPLFRGIYEDKVASVWCALSVIVKLKNIFEVDTLAKISIATTLVMSILIPAIPMTILLLEEPFAAALFHNVALFRFVLAAEAG
ncbi:Glucosyltransferase-like protein, partial [Phlyctochytrium planicorne]